MMKKTFAFALLLTLCSGSNAFGMDKFNTVLDTVNKYVADSVLNAQELPVIRHIFHEGKDAEGKPKSVLNEHARYPKAVFSVALAWFTYKSQMVRNFVDKVTSPVRNLVNEKK